MRITMQNTFTFMATTLTPIAPIPLTHPMLMTIAIMRSGIPPMDTHIRTTPITTLATVISIMLTSMRTRVTPIHPPQISLLPIAIVSDGVKIPQPSSSNITRAG